MSRRRSRRRGFFSRVAGEGVRIIILAVFTVVWWLIGWNLLKVISFPWMLRIVAVITGEALIILAAMTKGHTRRIFIYGLYTLVALIIWWFLTRWVLYTLDFSKVACYIAMAVGVISTGIAYIREIIVDDEGYWKVMLGIAFVAILAILAINYFILGLLFHITEC